MRLTQSIRKQFPLLIQRPEIVYLDSAATSLKPKAVIHAVSSYLSQYSANVHRGLYSIAEEATYAYEQARTRVASFLNASPQEIIFTKSTTEAINLVAYAWGRTHVSAGDEIVVSMMEHHSNFVPWQQLARKTDASLKVVDILEDGSLAWGGGILSPKTKLVAITHISNVLGTVNPITAIAKDVHRVGALLLVDGAQAVGHVPVDVRKLDVDFYACSGHKMYGPTGVGVLYGKRSRLEQMPPFLFGGHMIEQVTVQETTFAQPPAKFEAGTPPIAEAIGLGAAVDFLMDLDMRQVRSHEKEIGAYAIEKLELAGFTIFGPRAASARGGLVSFEVPGLHAHDVAQILAAHGVAVRAGHHCAMPLHTRLGVPATLRASFSVFTTKHEINRLGKALEKARDLLLLPRKARR